MSITAGHLYGIGVGPGDPELLTLKALRLLRTAPVVAYQSAENRPSVARSIVADYLPGNQIEVLFHLPRATDPIEAQPIYDKMVEPIAEHLEAGRDVAVLCEGDPLLYGSFMYLFTRLANQFETQVVPGICSPMASASVLGIPLSYRNDVFSIIPAPLPVELLTAQLLNADAAAIIKLGKHFTKVRDVLHQLGLASRVHYIERATTAKQRTIPLDEVDPTTVPYFSLILMPSKYQI